MSSPGQRRGTCGHIMASFDSHFACARCRDEGKGKDPCVEKPDSECKICMGFSPEQRFLSYLRLPTKLRKINERPRSLNPLLPKTESLVDPSDFAVLGAVDQQGTVKSPPSVAPREKKAKKEKASTSKTVKPTAISSMVDSKIAQLDEKWSDRFNRLEALLLARTIEPTFSSNVKLTPTHSPPASAVQSTEPFIRPVQPVPAATEFPGSGFSAVKHQLTSQTEINRPTTATMLPGTGSSAAKHQPTSKGKSSQQTSTELPGTGSSAAKHQ